MVDESNGSRAGTGQVARDADADGPGRAPIRCHGPGRDESARGPPWGMGRRALKALVGLQIVLRVASLAELLVRVLGRLPGKRLPTIIVGYQLIQGVRQPIDRRRGGQASRLSVEHQDLKGGL